MVGNANRSLRPQGQPGSARRPLAPRARREQGGGHDHDAIQLPDHRAGPPGDGARRRGGRHARRAPRAALPEVLADARLHRAGRDRRGAGRPPSASTTATSAAPRRAATRAASSSTLARGQAAELAHRDLERAPLPGGLPRAGQAAVPQDDARAPDRAEEVLAQDLVGREQHPVGLLQVGVAGREQPDARRLRRVVERVLVRREEPAPAPGRPAPRRARRRPPPRAAARAARSSRPRPRSRPTADGP